jgi:hypothetical protein
MKQPKITFTINGAVYSLSASDTDAIRKIPPGDRQHLIALLEQVKYQESLSLAAVQQAVDKARLHSRAAAGIPAAGVQPGQVKGHAERLGSGDIDALMARLVLEEKRSRKPAPTKRGVYKVIGVGAVLAVLLVLML